MSYFKTFRPLFIYLAIILLLALGLNLFIRSYSKANYSDQKKEALLSTPSQYRLLSEDPCANSIYGDPGNVGDNYIKVNINCSKENSSTNTLELRTISPDTYMGALQLVGNINSFEAGVIESRVDNLGNLLSEGADWRCFTGQDQEIKNFNEKLKNLVTINCFYKFNDLEIEEYYEGH